MGIVYHYRLRVRWPTVVFRTLPVTRRIGQPQAVSVARISCSCWPGQATSSVVVVHVSTANISQYPGRKHHLHNRETPCRAESRSPRSLHAVECDARKPLATRETDRKRHADDDGLLEFFLLVSRDGNGRAIYSRCIYRWQWIIRERAAATHVDDVSGTPGRETIIFE